jgi:hypothetical protein
MRRSSLDRQILSRAGARANAAGVAPGADNTFPKQHVIATQIGEQYRWVQLAVWTRSSLLTRHAFMDMA